MNLRSLNITEVHDGLVAGSFSCVDLCKAYLDRISEVNEELNVYITVIDNESVLERAALVD
jgi:Asp-tRNA(Asn)/Glu-tRNA(Gln) amidotransferase A subunit family amidase